MRRINTVDISGRCEAYLASLRASAVEAGAGLSAASGSVADAVPVVLGGAVTSAVPTSDPRLARLEDDLAIATTKQARTETANKVLMERMQQLMAENEALKTALARAEDVNAMLHADVTKGFAVADELRIENASLRAAVAPVPAESRSDFGHVRVLGASSAASAPPRALAT